MKKVLIISSNPEYDKMFKNMGWGLVDNIKDANLVQFTGGEDVSPELYNQVKHSTTRNNPKRDRLESVIYKCCLKMLKPMAGICRGGQFLNAMCGGSMFQDVDGHCKPHEAKLNNTDETLRVSSTHHQMMIPSDKGSILMSAKEASRKERYEEELLYSYLTLKNNWDDVEAIFYPIENVLCFQPHPEYSGYDNCRVLYFEMLDGLL